MAELRALYLVHGEDHGGVAERRRRLRALAEQQGGAAGVEVLDGERASPGAVANALATMTLAVGRRVLIVDGVERWRKDDLAPLERALGAIPPETTLALFAREDNRAKAPPSLHQAVKKAGGQIVSHDAVKPWKLAEWVRAQAATLGLALDPAAARALVAQVGERQQRLLRELEKLALELAGEGQAAGAWGDTGEGQAAGEVSAARARAARPLPVGVEQIEQRAAHSAEMRAWVLGDALVAGDELAALRAYLALEAEGERVGSLTYPLVSRMREALLVSRRLREGESTRQIAASLRMPKRAAERFVVAVERTDSERLKRGLAALADLEVDLRGGGQVTSSKRPAASLSERTLAVATIAHIAPGD